jgi:curli biogenesis system outer membrane secretion channel CsgG
MKMLTIKKVMCSMIAICMMCSCAHAKIVENNVSVTPLKKTVAVADFEIKSGGVAGDFDLSRGMAEMLTDALIQSGQFIVLERQTIDAVLAEQNFAASDRTSAVGGAQKGDIKRAQILIQGVVTEYDVGAESGGQQVNIAGFGFGGKKAKAHMACFIRVIDSTTSEVIDSQRVEGKASQGGTDFTYAGGDINYAQNNQTRTPINKAMQITIDNAVEYIAKRMRGIPWQGKVISVKDSGEAYINAGQTANMQKGMTFMVFRPGEELIDPDTGMNLGSDDQFIGRLRVDDVKPKFSKGTTLDASAQAGDIVKVTA